MKQKSSCVWHLNRNCNFRCEYCYIRFFRKDEPGHGVEKDIKAFKSNNIDWQIVSMSGGEPFIYPDFVDLCKKMTGFCKIVIDTNCSTSNVYDFADSINPKKVKEIHCSLHLGQRPHDDYDKLIERVLYLRNRGFYVFVTQVLHPHLFEDYKKMFIYFKKKNILINPKVMEGVWHFKEYPQAYKNWQKRFILDYAERSLSQSSKHLNFHYSTMVYGTLDWKDRKCGAGFNHFEIDYNGDCFRCHGDKRYLGNLYDESIKLDSEPLMCYKNLCKCEAEGWKGHKGQGFIHQHQSLKEIAKAYGMDVTGRIRRWLR